MKNVQGYFSTNQKDLKTKQALIKHKRAIAKCNKLVGLSAVIAKEDPYAVSQLIQSWINNK